MGGRDGGRERGIRRVTIKLTENKDETWRTRTEEKEKIEEVEMWEE